MQKDLHDSNPFGEIVIQTNGLFKSVCCQEFKDAILAKKIEVTISDCMTCYPSQVLTDPELIKMVCKGEDRPLIHTDLDYTETDECPFCKKKINDCFVE